MWAGRAPRYEIVRLLLAAGADHGQSFRYAICCEYHRLWPLFLQAGAAIPNTWRRTQAFNEEQRQPEVAQRYEYLRTIEEAGGFKAYEKAHRTRLLATFTPKFTHLVPEELVPLIVDFSFHVGFYVSAAAVAALPRAAETNPNQDA